MLSILHRVSRAEVLLDPFPHVVVHGALEEGVYEQLAREFPSAEVVGAAPGANPYAFCHARELLSDPRISPLWRELAVVHTSAAFFREVVAIFGDAIGALHPGLEEKLGKPLGELRSSVRFRDEPADFALECQAVRCAPAKVTARSIGPHVDREVALYAGLLYFRRDDDDSTGGDLELFRFRDGRRRFGPRNRAEDDDVVAVKTIPYRRNTLIFFLHSPDSLHGVTPRTATASPRLHVNFVAEAATKLFDLDPYRSALPA